MSRQRGIQIFAKKTAKLKIRVDLATPGGSATPF
jgi:hypothetical protein